MQDPSLSLPLRNKPATPPDSTGALSAAGATAPGAAPEPQLAEQLIRLGRYLHSRQWMPANTGNFSHRLGTDNALITADRSNKGALSAADLIAVDKQSRALDPDARSPSSEAAVHMALYGYYPQVNAIVHTHSTAGTILSRLGDEVLVLENYEVLNSLDGISAHDARITLPIFSNYQDHGHLARWFNRYVIRFPNHVGFLIRGHGLYTWGTSPTAALRHLEALEFMLECEMRMAQIHVPGDD